MRLLSRILPLAAFAATFGFFFVDKNREARTVLRSGRGLLVVVALVVAYLVIGTAVRRVVRFRLATSVVMSAAVLGAASWTILPYYTETTANRTVVSGAVEDAPFLPTELDVAPIDDAAAAPTTSPVPVATRLSTGALQGIDHTARGNASVVRGPDGTLVVRLEDFAIEGAPDPVVYLVEGEDVRTRRGVNLGALPGNRGELLDIKVPADTRAGPGWTVLIWCERFAVPIANATQR
ncbi:MAG TPA: DM13 domain-containing protein [Acidimicrobiales bacterium]|nr:DM13 domain-containing protein [Acidimicrobiales bacterium]